MWYFTWPLALIETMGNATFVPSHCGRLHAQQEPSTGPSSSPHQAYFDFHQSSSLLPEMTGAVTYNASQNILEHNRLMASYTHLQYASHPNN